VAEGASERTGDGSRRIRQGRGFRRSDDDHGARGPSAEPFESE